MSCACAFHKMKSESRQGKNQLQRELRRYTDEFPDEHNLITFILNRRLPVQFFTGDEKLSAQYPNLFKYDSSLPPEVFARGLILIKSESELSNSKFRFAYRWSENGSHFYLFSPRTNSELITSADFESVGVRVFGVDSTPVPILRGEGVLQPISKSEIASLLLQKGASSEKVSAWLAASPNNLSFSSSAVELLRLGEDERKAVRDGVVETLVSSGLFRTFAQDEDRIVGLYKFDGSVWKPYGAKIEKDIEDLLESMGFANLSNNQFVKEVVEKVKRKTFFLLREEDFAIAFKNGVFDWRSFLGAGGSLVTSFSQPSPHFLVFSLVPHRVDRAALSSVETSYRVEGLAAAAAKHCPHILKAFQDWVGEKFPLLFEIAGYTLLPKYSLNKTIMLFGEGKKGKSTYINFLNWLLGEQNVSNIELQELLENRFLKAELFHKLLNSYSDLPPRALRQVGAFKTLTGEDFITADRKNRSPIRFKNYAKLVFSANVLPKVPQSEWNQSAWWRRWLLIEFDRFDPSQADPDFFSKTFTEDELSRFIPLALLAVRDVLKRKRFSFEEGESSYREVWMRMTNPAYDFLRAGLLGETAPFGFVLKAEKENPFLKVSTDDLYDKFVEWCLQRRDETAPSKKALSMEVSALGFRVSVGRGENGRVKKFYVGLGLAEPPMSGSETSTASPSVGAVGDVVVEGSRGGLWERILNFIGDEVKSYDDILAAVGGSDDEVWRAVAELSKRGDIFQVAPLKFKRRM